MAAIRRHAYYKPRVLARLEAIGVEHDGVGLGEATRILLDERDGNWQRLRHELSRPLNQIVLECGLARRDADAGRRVDARLSRIQELVHEAALLLARPEPRPESKTPPADAVPPAASIRE